nr:RNA polymerase sigma factor [Kitasatospora kifunensis]
MAVRAAQGGDEEAFRLVFRTVQPLLLRYLRVLVGGDGSLASDAEDIASETWLQITRDLHTFHGDGDGFRGWAATIARHRALDHLRARRRRPTAELPEEYLSELPAREDTEGSALATVGTQQALAMIAGLPKDQAEAVLLRVVLQLDAESAARVLGKRAGSVRMAAHRGLRRLAKLLESSDAVPPRHGPSKRLEKKSAEGVTQPGASTLKDMR